MPVGTSSQAAPRSGPDEQARELADGNTPVGVMSVRLGRTEGHDPVQDSGARHRTGSAPSLAVRRHGLTLRRMLVPWAAGGGAGDAKG